VKGFLRNVRLFFIGALGFDNATDKLRKKALYTDLDLLTLILSDEIGIPNPLYYHTVELLPYLSSEVEAWRESERASILWRVLGEIGEP